MSSSAGRPAERCDAGALERFAADLFMAAGSGADKAADVAWSLVEADCIGHATHGLAIAPWYLEDMLGGGMALRGDVGVIRDRAGCIAWNGRRLPGACHASTPRPGVDRVPGDRAAERRAAARSGGMALDRAIVGPLIPLAEKAGLRFPEPAGAAQAGHNKEQETADD